MLQGSLDGLLENFVCDFRVHRTQRIIKQVDIGVLIDCSGQTDSCLLAARNVDSSLADYSVLTIRKLKHIRTKATRLNSHIESLFVIHQSKSYVFADCRRKYKRLLLNVSNLSLYCLHAANLPSLVHDRIQKRSFS